MKSKIEWTDRTWNPVRGCSRVSEGCRNCYAERFAARFSKPGEPFYDFVSQPITARIERDLTGNAARWTGKVALVPDKLDEPLRWRKPCRVFVNSMSDLFHEGLPDDDIAAVFGVMAAAPSHTFQLLTKRSKRMLRFLSQRDQWSTFKAAARRHGVAATKSVPEIVDWSRDPLPNVWLGVSVEDQATADARIPHLLATPAAVRFVSYEPALGPVDFDEWLQADKDYCSGCFVSGPDSAADCMGHDVPRLDWLIVGGESGPGARPCDVAWLRSAVAQCKAAGVPVFVKQLGARASDPVNGLAGAALDVPSDAAALVSRRLRDPKGGDPSEWPEDLRVREFPR